MSKLKILKYGETDIESTDIWRFAFHSDYPTFKIATNGNDTFSIASGNNFGEKVVTHNLGYIPFVFAAVEYNSKLFLVTRYVLSGETVPATHDWLGDIDSELIFELVITSTQIKIGASIFDSPDATVNNTVNLRAHWIIMLDEF